MTVLARDEEEESPPVIVGARDRDEVATAAETREGEEALMDAWARVGEKAVLNERCFELCVWL